MRTIQASMLVAAAFAAASCGDNLGGGGEHLPGPPSTTATPIAGVYREGPVVTLTASEEATIYYTVDGSEPTTDSASGATPVTIDEGLEAGGTVRFFAVDTEGDVEEPSKEIAYVVDRLGPAPVDDFAVAVDGRDAEITWKNPSADGFETVVVARVTDSSATRPADGETYAVGDELTGGGEVVFVGPAEEAAEAGLTPGGVAYMAWALYDTGNYSEPRGHGAAVELPAQTGRLTVDMGAGTVTVSDERELSFFDVEGDNVVFDTGNGSFDVTVTPNGPNILYNVKVVVTAINSLVDPTLTNSDGTIADGGDHDGLAFKYYGPAAMADGEGVTRTFTVNPVLVNSVFTVDFAIVRDRGVVETRWWSNPEFGGAMYDFGSNVSTDTLPQPVHYDGLRLAQDYTSYRGAVLTWDGRFMIAGSRTAARVEKVDLTTMEVVGGLDVDIERDTGSVSDIVANQARTRLYAIVNDGMHTASSQRSVAAHTERLTGFAMRDVSDVPDGNDVYVVEIDADTMEEVARVHLGGGNILFRGRRGAIARDDRQLAVPTGEHWREQTDMELPDFTSFVNLVDLSAMAAVDTDDEEDGVQPIDLTDVSSVTALTFTHDGARLVVNRNYNTAEQSVLDILGAVIDLADYSVETFDPPEDNLADGIKGYAPLPDGRVVIGGDWDGLRVLDPTDGTFEAFGDYAGQTYGMSIDPGGAIYISDDISFAIVDSGTGDVVESVTLPDNYFAHTPTPTVY